jgi:hypothetical protein
MAPSRKHEQCQTVPEAMLKEMAVPVLTTAERNLGREGSAEE